jgi:hypothetical protein
MTALTIPRLVRTLLSLGVAAAILAGGSAFATAPAKKMAPPDAFMPLDAITVSVLERARVCGFLTVEFGLYVTDKALREEVDTNLRALKDAYVRVMVDYGAGEANVSIALDLAGIANRLQRVTDTTLGRAGARVLFTQAQLRKLH